MLKKALFGVFDENVKLLVYCELFALILSE